MTTHVQRLALATAAASALALAAGAASASQFLPATSYSLTAFPNGPNGSHAQQITTAGSVSATTNNVDGFASGAATASSQFVSADSVSVFAPDHSNEGYGAASETYYFSVVGGLDEAVPLLITGAGHTYSTGGAGYVEVDENINNITNFGRTCFVGSGTCGDFSYSQSVSITSNTVAYLSLSAFSVVQGGSNGGWIDPMITIDPNFADAGHFHLVFSDGISNGTGLAPGVPEPSAWALMIAGFGVAGAALRRRRPALA